MNANCRQGTPAAQPHRAGPHDYFSSLNGHRPARLYDLVLREVEEPLFRAVLDYAAGNQSRAAEHPRHQPRDAAQETAHDGARLT